MEQKQDDILLRVEHLKMYFPVSRGLLGRKTGAVKAIDDISFDIKEGETFGLVGESGCGKTTTGRCILRIYQPTGGRIVYDGVDISNMTEQQLYSRRRAMQMIFQDP